MYWGMPAVSARDRLERAPALDPATVKLSPLEAAESVGATPSPAQIRLNSFDGRPAYRFGAGGRGWGRADRLRGHRRGAGRGVVPRARSRGRRLDRQTSQRGNRAVGHRNRPVDGREQPAQPAAAVEVLLAGRRPGVHRRIRRGAAAHDDDVAGEGLPERRPALAVLHAATEASAGLDQVATYSAWVGTVGAILGVVVGLWLYSPSKKYLFAGQPSRIPYRGQKRWHTILGLIFGVATVTWTLSGSLAFWPFPAPSPPQTAAAPRRRHLRRDRAPAVAGTPDLRPRCGVASPWRTLPRRIRATCLRGTPACRSRSWSSPRSPARRCMWPPRDGSTRRFSLDGGPSTGLTRRSSSTSSGNRCRT